MEQLLRIKPQEYLPWETEWEEAEGMRRTEELFENWKPGKKIGNVKPTGTGSIVDAVSEDITAGTFTLEHKLRDCAHDKYSDIMIEPKKLENIIFLWKKRHLQTLYANYFNDGWAFLFDMARIIEAELHKGFRYAPEVWIKYTERGRTYYKKEPRYFIPAKYAIQINEKYKTVYEPEWCIDKIRRKANLIDLNQELPASKINKLINGKTTEDNIETDS